MQMTLDVGATQTRWSNNPINKEYLVDWALKAKPSCVDRRVLLSHFLENN